MSSKSVSLSMSPGAVLSVFCLLLYSAGFIRIEVKFDDHEQRLVAVEEVISHIRQGMADTSMKGKESLKNVWISSYFSYVHFPIQSDCILESFDSFCQNEKRNRRFNHILYRLSMLCLSRL